jgi:hypothetical protein
MLATRFSAGAHQYLTCGIYFIPIFAVNLHLYYLPTDVLLCVREVNICFVPVDDGHPSLLPLSSPCLLVMLSKTRIVKMTGIIIHGQMLL